MMTKMIRARVLLAAFVLFLTPNSWADEERTFREFSFAPSVGYSTFSGFVGGAWFSLGLPLSAHWQWDSGGHVFGGRRSHNSEGLRLGLSYNFSDDWTRSFYLGAGVGMARNYLATNGGYAYARLGKRFALNESRTWYYKPEFNYQFEDDSRYKMYLVVHLAQISFSF